MIASLVQATAPVTTATVTTAAHDIVYFANPVRGIKAIMSLGREVGMIQTPAQMNKIPQGAWWCADNGMGPGRKGVIKGESGKGAVTSERLLKWLGKFTADERDRCMFAVAPDVVGDAMATHRRAVPVLSKIRELGFPVAWVAQDGLVYRPGWGWGAWDGRIWLPIPWDEIDAIFLGGSDQAKLSGAFRELVAEAKARGKWVHMGRVNSYVRLAYAKEIGCDSADGTYLVRGARKAPQLNPNIPKLLGWLAALNHRPITSGAFELIA